LLLKNLVSAKNNNINNKEYFIIKGNIAEDYMILEPKISDGAFGYVKKAIHKASKIERAVKFLRKDIISNEE
jgi:hypothetical protein